MNNYTTNLSGTIVSNPPLALLTSAPDNARLPRNTAGNAAEEYALQLLEKSGYEARKCLKSDFQVINPETGEFWLLEVKSAQRRPDGKYVFQLLNAGTDYRHSTMLLLLAILKAENPVPFVIPTDEFTIRSTIVITSHPLDYAGMWSEYRQPQHQITLERTRK